MQTFTHLLLLLGLSIGVSPFAIAEGLQPQTCSELESQLLQYAAADQEFHRQAVAQTAQYSIVFNDLHEQLATLEGQLATDLTVAIGTVRGLEESLNNFANLLFERAEENAAVAENWKEMVQRCHGDTGLQALDEWMIIDYEILTSTAGGYFSLYAQKVMEWIPVWEGMQANKSLIPPDCFSAVASASNEMQESASLTEALYDNIEESFSSLLNQQ